MTMHTGELQGSQVYVFSESVSILLLKTSMCILASLFALLIERGMNLELVPIVQFSKEMEFQSTPRKVFCLTTATVQW